MALTIKEIQSKKPKDKPYKLTDERGLYLLINPNGSKLWKLKYRFAGVEKNSRKEDCLLCQCRKFVASYVAS